jgi:hypothetical protein
LDKGGAIDSSNAEEAVGTLLPPMNNDTGGLVHTGLEFKIYIRSSDFN